MATPYPNEPEVEGADGNALDLAPAPDEQMAIVTALEEEEESLHVYSVSKEWYRKWRIYVGLPEFRDSNSGRSAPPEVSTSKSAKSRRGAVDTTAPPREHSGTTPSECDRNYSPGPITMDLSDDEGNIYADEKIWKCWVRWYGVSSNHELDRRNWASDDKDFEICVLSPYCGLIENPVKTFDVSEECGYIEIQLRQIFRIPKHRSTRLWICEKARHSRFQPLLFREREVCSYDYFDASKSYIMALEVAHLDGSWPTFVTGMPTGSFDAYRDLTEGGPRLGSSVWEAGLSEALDTVFGAINSELKETANGIVQTARCVTAVKEKDLDAVKDALRTKAVKYEEGQAMVEEMTRDLRREETALELEKKKFHEEKEAFREERHLFAEELVRMHTINMIQETRVKLNVGGHVFMTSTFTLTKEPDSMLAAMFSGRHALKQEDDGSYFLDRDGTHFRYILNYLRDGSFRQGALPTDRTFLSELLSEAEYFQIGGLVALLSGFLRSADEDSSSAKVANSSSGSAKAFSSLHARMGPSPSPIRRSVRRTNSHSKSQDSNS